MTDSVDIADSILDAKAIGLRVKETRHARGWFQRVLAEKSGVDPSVIGLIETGERLPSRDAVLSIAIALGKPLEWILCGEPCTRVWKREKK